MQAGTYARQLVTAFSNGDSEHYNRLLGFADVECRMLARYPRRWELLSADKRMIKAFEKWEAIYRAVHTAMGDRPPPPPLFYAGPYLIILNTLVAEKNSDRHFSAKLVMLGHHAVEARAAKCDVFDRTYREHMLGNQQPQDAVTLQRAKNSLNKLYEKYIRCIGPFAIKREGTTGRHDPP